MLRNFQKPGRSLVLSNNGMVASSHSLSSSIGVEILKKGGNAVDAAMAMAFVLPLCEPQSTGYFGDLFCIISQPNDEKFIGLNGSGKSPNHANSEILKSNGFKKIPETNISSITLPGAMKAFESLHNNFCKLDLYEICKPAITYAEQGVPVSPRVAFDWNYSIGNLKGVAKEFYTKNGASYKIGDLFKAPQQAKVLREFAKNGAKGFYEGEVANDLISSLNKLGGVHTLNDLKNVSFEYVDPITINFDKHALVELPPNGQGVTAFLIKKMLDRLNISNFDPSSAERVHLEAEVVKIAYIIRNKYIGDPNFYDFELKHFFSDEFIEKYLNQIDLNKANNEINTKWENHHRDTVYLTVIDKNRQMVSLIFSIFNSFGSGYASEKFGLLFHNRGAGFTLESGHPNELVGNKRPLHTIIPAFLKKDDEFIMPFGVMGGQYQANGHARLVSNVIDFGMDIQTAIDFPRSFPENGYLKLEEGYTDKIAKDLEKMGHKILRPDQPIGGAQAIIYDMNNDILIGGSDPRKDGCALGY